MTTSSNTPIFFKELYQPQPIKKRDMCRKRHSKKLRDFYLFFENILGKK